MWPLLFILAAAAAITIHLHWRNRFAAATAATSKARAESERALAAQRTLLLQAQAQQHGFFNSMIEGVLALDPQGRVQVANDALRAFFELDSDVRGKTLMEVFRLHELVELRERTLREKQVRGFELDLSGATSQFFEINAATLARDGEADAGMVFVFHDVTRLRQLEATRREFVANVSHELRTPLTMIKGFVETLLSSEEENREISRRFLTTIDKHTDRLIFLIEDLLTISRLESGQVVLNAEPLQLRNVADQVIDSLRARADENEVTIANLIPDEVFALADFDRIQQVFANLIENAIKYGGRRGAVELTASRSLDGDVQVSVRDHGQGIPPESLERVFERFYRVDRARTREQGGTGLGLAIVKHIVQSHGGKVWAENAPDSGAIFHFTLPPTPKTESLQ